MATLEAVVADSAEFNPARAQGEISIGVEEYSGYVLLPQLIKRLPHEAPNMKVMVYRIGMAREDVIEAAHAFDFVFSRLPGVPTAFEREVVLVDSTVLVAARNHPIFTSPITLESYLAYPHMVPTWQHSVPSTAIDLYLESKGRRRRVRVGLPPGMHMTITGMLGDILTAIPGRFGLMFADSAATQLAALPFPLPLVELSMVWHKKHRADGQHQWMRELVKTVCDEVAATPVPGLANNEPKKRRQK